MTKIAIVLATALLLSGCAASAAVQESSTTDGTAVATSEGPDQAAAEKAPGDAGDEIALAGGDEESEEICTREYRTGSRIPVKYCRTKAEDERARADSRGWLEKVKKTPQQSIETG